MKLNNVLLFILMAYVVYFSMFAIYVLNDFMSRLIFSSFTGVLLTYIYLQFQNREKIFEQFQQIIKKRKTISVQYLSDITGVPNNKISPIFEYYLKTNGIKFEKKKSGGYIKYVIS